MMMITSYMYTYPLVFKLETSSILSLLSQLNLQTNTMFHAMQCEELGRDYWKGKVRKLEETRSSVL